ncbi:transcriptional regulator ATRX-like [Atheta coriaria]|uniref:transcriptional regulator ATRX-like n=1 Tax=Dalotia coriaria TaxID=877792 RepID=UPI0031F39FEE
MDLLSPVSDDEREDGEIVDDDLEDISDYSIPSSGKSDYSEGIIRAISLSSISDCGDRDYSERKALLKALTEAESVPRRCRRAALKARTKTSSSSVGSHKRRRHAIQEATRTRKHRRKSYSRSASLSSSSDSSLDERAMDRQTLQQLNKAVRIDTNNTTDEISHKTLKDRLKRMMQPDVEENLESSVKEDNYARLDETFDKELEELRLQALKSAMLKKHMERKKRKEAENAKLVQEGQELNSNDKENENNSNNPLIETKTIEIIDVDEDPAEITVDDDLDIMRAMLLASMSNKITTEQPSPNPVQPLNLGSLCLSSSSSPIPPEFVEKKKLTSNFTVPPVKPLIIRVNHDSESDTDFDYDEENNKNKLSPVEKTTTTKIQSSVEEFLRKQREQFEAKLAQNETKETSLDKSFLKLLPQSQQQEYKLLREKLLQAKKASKNPTTTTTKETKDKKDRSQPKGKYRELAPLVRKINAELAAQRRQEERVTLLQEQLKATRVQAALHQRRHAVLVAQLKKARAIVDLRWQKAKLEVQQQQQANQNSIPPKAVVEKAVSENNNVKSSSAIVEAVDTSRQSEMHPEKEPVQESTVVNVKVDLDVNVPEPMSYVSPLDKREVATSSNPLQTLCPYELFGVCKDTNCTFNHCP